MNKTKLFGSITMLTGVALTLAACSNGNSSKSTNATQSKFKSEVPKAAVKKGGSVSIAIETDTPFTGIFNDELESSATDASVMAPGDEPLFKTDDNYKIVNGGAANLKLNVKAKTATITINPKVKWSDGKPLVAKDIEYAYEIIANKDTKSERYTDSLQDIVGMSEYHDGKSKTISGIDMTDGANGRKVVLHFKVMKPGMTQSGNGYFWEAAAPYHYLKDVPFKKLVSSNKIRKNPLFYGPFRMTKLVRGQSATWAPNKYYYKGKPNLSKITESVVSPNSAAQAIKSHKFDITDVVNSQWQNVKNTKGVNFIANVPLFYSYLGFKVGKWDAKTGKNVMNPKAKMNNRALRQAIAYAMNVNEVYKRYTSGLTFRIPTLIPAQFGKYYDKNAKGYTYNIKKANQILDKAGFKKKGTYRRLPNGKPLTIKLAAMTGSSTQEPIIQNYIQQWKKIGLHVVLSTGRLIEFNSFYDKIENDDPQVDMFMGAWSLSSEPSPNDLYNEEAPFNFTRFVTKKQSKLLARIDSQKSFNSAYRVKAFHEWQDYMNKEAYVVPVSNSYAITAVNSKLTNYSLKPSDTISLWSKLGYKK